MADKRSFVGFYWTLPVNWADFRRLPKDAAEAATKSKTIYYQRELCRRHAAAEGGRIVEEFSFIDIRPDRATYALVDAMNMAGEAADRANATLVYVNFEEIGWRRRPPELLSRRLHGRWHGIYPDSESVVIGDTPFNPARHFRAWDDLNKSERYRRRDRITGAFDTALRNFPAKAGRYAQIAAFFNSGEFDGEPVRSSTGKPWTEENVRKYMKKIGSN